MPAPVIAALEQAMYAGSSPKLYYWAFKHPNPDAPPQTYRLTRRAGNGWAQLLAASRETKQVLAFYAPTAEDEAAVAQALTWLGISGRIERGAEGPVLKLPDGSWIASTQPGGEKPKKKA
jgi:hypothetical protein